MDIAEFYDADPRRRESEEIIYGDGWTQAGDPHSTYRVSWVADTGEVYTVREPHPGGLLARYLDELEVEQADADELRVEVLGTFDGDRVEAALGGWRTGMHGDHSLDWVRARLTAAG